MKIDNARRARPHTGLNAADVVYVEQVEGGLSRRMAVYATRLPDIVGPVRSARESDLELLRQFDGPTLAFSGAAQAAAADRRGAAARRAARPHAPGSGASAAPRTTSSCAPAPAAAGPAALTTGFRYGAAPAGGTEVASRTVTYPSARFTFTWSESRDRWLVSMDGEAAATTDAGRVAPATVVVQYVKLRRSDYFDVLGNNTPFTETVGSGRAQALRDGKAHDARWKRATAAGGPSSRRTTALR
ncbi:Secreted protein OS=Streptomyces glaucescens OX=1907 GN=SGLAU_28030 PE=4 SV=1 [Streptomyces glaucescens]